MPIQPLLQIEAALIRRQLPDLLLRPGMTLAARVAERTGRLGIIVLAGEPLVAELPDEVKAGDRLRLAVQESRVDKVVLKLVPDEPAAPAQPPAIPLPGGVAARIEREGEGEGGEVERDREHAAITIRFEAEAVGQMAFALTLAPGAVQVRAEVEARAFESADAAAHALESRLAAATGRAAQVRVEQRRDPIDVYA